MPERPETMNKQTAIKTAEQAALNGSDTWLEDEAYAAAIAAEMATTQGLEGEELQALAAACMQGAPDSVIEAAAGMHGKLMTKANLDRSAAACGQETADTAKLAFYQGMSANDAEGIAMHMARLSEKKKYDDPYKQGLSDMMRARLTLSAAADARFPRGNGNPRKSAEEIGEKQLKEIAFHTEQNRKTERVPTPMAASIKEAKDSVFDQCMDMGYRMNHYGIKTMTAPPGAGKTIGTLAFALKKNSGSALQRLIFIAPHQSLADGTVESIQRFIPDAVDDTHPIPVGSMLCPKWDGAKCIITTADRFLRRLMADDPKSLRDLHCIGMSTIVFDEFHCIPPGLMPDILMMLAELAKGQRYMANIVLSSSMWPECWDMSGTEVKMKEIIKDTEKLFDAAPLRKFAYCGTTSITKPVSDAKSESSPSGACVVYNDSEHAEKAYETSTGNVFLLTGKFCRADRSIIEQEIKEEQEKRSSPTVITTYRAITDTGLSFGQVATEATPLPWLIRASGCQDRNGKDGRRTPITIFRTDQAKKEGHDAGRAQLANAACCTAGESDLSGKADMQKYIELTANLNLAPESLMMAVAERDYGKYLEGTGLAKIDPVPVIVPALFDEGAENIWREAHEKAAAKTPVTTEDAERYAVAMVDAARWKNMRDYCMELMADQDGEIVGSGVWVLKEDHAGFYGDFGLKVREE